MRVIRIAVIVSALYGACGVSGQTISLKQHGQLYLKFARTDTLKWMKFDLSHPVDWQLDTIGRADSLRCEKEIDPFRSIQPFVWTTLSDFRNGLARHSLAESVTTPNGLIMPNARMAFFVVGQFDVMTRDPAILTIWDLVGSDSMRYRCGALTEYRRLSDVIKVVKGVQFPDSSVLLHLNMTDEPNREYEKEEGNWFYQIKPACDVRLLYKSIWYRDLKGPTKWVMLDLSGLDDQHYEVRETTNFGWGGVTRLSDLPVDSSKTRVIDLWELAKAKTQIDTTQH